MLKYDLKNKGYFVEEYTFTLNQKRKKKKRNRLLSDLKTYEFQCLWKSLLVDR